MYRFFYTLINLWLLPNIERSAYVKYDISIEYLNWIFMMLLILAFILYGRKSLKFQVKIVYKSGGGHKTMRIRQAFSTMPNIAFEVLNPGCPSPEWIKSSDISQNKAPLRPAPTTSRRHDVYHCDIDPLLHVFTETDFSPCAHKRLGWGKGQIFLRAVLNWRENDFFWFMTVN